MNSKTGPYLSIFVRCLMALSLYSTRDCVPFAPFRSVRRHFEA